MNHSRLAILAVTAALLASLLTGARAGAATTFIKGVDVSIHQNVINWTSVKNGGYDFAFVKATEGVDFIDSKFTTNITGASAAGLSVGPYHFAHPESYNGVAWGSTYDGQALSPTSPTALNRNGYADATSEAADFLDAIRPYYHQTGNTKFLRPVADIERFPSFTTTALNKTFVSNWTQIFSDAVLADLGVRPIIYTSQSNANTYYTSAIASVHPLWVAWWKGTGTASPPVQSNTPTWPAWSFWQWSDGADSIALADPVPGISVGTNVDRDVFSGTLADLANYRLQIAAGDADFNGRVNADDYFRIDAGYSRHATGWANGDFNWNGQINGDDYAIIDAAFATAPHAPLPAEAVPEPTSFALAGVSLACVVAFRKKSRRPR